MQNKNISLKTAYSLPNSRYYRSIRYKISNNSMSKVPDLAQTDPNRTQPAQSRPYSTWRKPSSYSIRKQSKNKEMNSIQNVEDQKNNQMKISYIQTWDTLLHPAQKLKQIQAKNKLQRVCLPSIIDYDPSIFTSLDPLFLPFDHIQKGIAKLKAELPPPRVQMCQIHSDMVNFKQKILKELQETKQYGIKEFARLRKMLRADKVLYQQGNMRFKRYCQDLQQLDQNYKRDFQETKPRLDVLQIELFSNRPFELARNVELDEQFPQAYF